MKINLISRDNGVGLTHDVKIIRDIAESLGHLVTFSDLKAHDKTETYNLNIFIELLHPKWFKKATINWLIPNPEWYDVRWKRYAPKFHTILCKTKSATNAFSILNKKSTYTSFTSLDRFLPVEKNYNEWIHVAGRSLQKSTDIVYDCWKQHPEFPHLTILQHPEKTKPRDHLPNLTYRYEVMEDSELRLLQNQCGFHLCPSETEGFGHYINEAMSCESIVVTTNAPPMNELVTADRGVFCDYQRKDRQRLALAYFVNVDTLAEGVKKALSLSTLERQRMSKNAREFYLRNDNFFRNNLTDLLQKCTIHAKHNPYPSLEKRRFPPGYSRLHQRGHRS